MSTVPTPDHLLVSLPLRLLKPIRRRFDNSVYSSRLISSAEIWVASRIVPEFAMLTEDPKTKLRKVFDFLMASLCFSP